MSKPDGNKLDFDDIFAVAQKKEPVQESDPFSMLMRGAGSMASEKKKEEFNFDDMLGATKKQEAIADESPEFAHKESTTEVGGTGGGWDDDEDDIDIE